MRELAPGFSYDGVTLKATDKAFAALDAWHDGDWIVEASTLGLEVGAVPQFVEVEFVFDQQPQPKIGARVGSVTRAYAMAWQSEASWRYRPVLGPCAIPDVVIVND